MQYITHKFLQTFSEIEPLFYVVEGIIFIYLKLLSQRLFLQQIL